MAKTFLCWFQTLGCNFSTSNQAKKAIIQVYIADLTYSRSYVSFLH